MAIGWKLVGDGKPLPLGAVVRPDERLSWPKTIGVGAQHVVAMFGATFVFPLIMGLDPNLAIMMSGVCTILFLLVVANKIPSYLGTSASFVGAVVAIRASGGSSADVTGAIMVAGLTLAAVGILIHFVGGRALRKVLPPVVSGAVVMLIGFNLAPVVAGVYWPQDPGVAFTVMVFTIVAAVAFRGFWSRIAIFLALIFGFVLSYVLDKIVGEITAPTGAGDVTTHFRVDLSGVSDAAWFGFPTLHAPEFQLNFILLALPGVIALIAENTGHVRAVAEMTGDDLDPYMGRALLADGLGTALSSSIGGSPTTTYAENIGVMAATRVYSTAAYYVAAIVAILLGLVPEVRRRGQRDSRRSARRDHRRAVRDDRPARREDLDREQGQFRQSGESGADRGGHHHRGRRGGHVVRGQTSCSPGSRWDPSWRSSPTTWPGCWLRGSCGNR